MIPLYLRREPTTDFTALAYCAASKHPFPSKWCDVVAYADEACTVRRATWPWWHNKPTRKAKRVTLNCYYWKAVWLPDLTKS